MPDPILLLKANALAAAACGVIVGIARRFGRVGGAIGAALGAMAGAWMLGLASHVPPRDALERFLLVLLPVVAVADAIPHRWTRTTLRLGVAAAATPLLIHGSSYVTDQFGPGSREWSVGRTVSMEAGLGFALFLAWTAVTRLAERSGRSIAIAVSGTAAVAGITVMLSGYASGGQWGLALAAVAGVLALVGSRHPGAGIGVVLVGLFGLLVVAWLFAGLAPLNGALLFAAPLLAWLPESLPVGPRMRGGLRVGLTAVPVAVALFAAQQKFVRDSAGPSPGEASVDDYR